MTRMLTITDQLAVFLALLDSPENSCRTRMKESDLLIMNAMVGRFKAMPFTTTKKMTDFRDALVKELDKHIAAEAAKRNLKAHKARLAKADRDRVQSEICARWAKLALKANELVKLRNNKSVFQVLEVNQAQVVVIEVKKRTANGDIYYDSVKEPITVSYEQLHKILSSMDKWTDIYEIASGLEEA